MVAERIIDSPEGGGAVLGPRIRELARGHLPLIMPERSITVGDLLGQDDDIGMLVNGIDPRAMRRRSARERNRRRHKGETVDSTPEPVPEDFGSPARARAKTLAALPLDQRIQEAKAARRTRKHHPSKETIKRDWMLERAVPLEPVMVHLVRLCLAADARRGAFIEAYCWLLSRSPRGVGKEALTELAAGEPFVMTVRNAYYWLSWGYSIFSGWALGEYLDGHVFTAEDLAPMRAWVETQAAGWPLESKQEENGEDT